MSVGYFDNMIDWNYHDSFTGHVSSNTTYTLGNMVWICGDDGFIPKEQIYVPTIQIQERIERCRYCGVRHENHEKFCEGCGAPC